MKTCPSCSVHFEPRNHFNSTIKSKYCDLCTKTRQALKNLERIKKEDKKRLNDKKKELLTVQDWHKLAQQVFNKFIRIRDKDKPCISCNAKAGTYTLTAGHFIPSTNKSVTYNEDNLHGQCWFNCNSSKSGNLHEYRRGLIDRIGVERLEELEAEARKIRKYTIEELKEIIETYKEKIKNHSLLK